MTRQIEGLVLHLLSNTAKEKTFSESRPPRHNTGLLLCRLGVHFRLLGCLGLKDQLSFVRYWFVKWYFITFCLSVLNFSSLIVVWRSLPLSLPPSLLAGDIPLQRGHHVHQQHVPSFCSPPLHWVHPLLQGKPTESCLELLCHFLGFGVLNWTNA